MKNMQQTLLHFSMPWVIQRLGCEYFPLGIFWLQLIVAQFDGARTTRFQSSPPKLARNGHITAIHLHT